MNLTNHLAVVRKRPVGSSGTRIRSILFLLLGQDLGHFCDGLILGIVDLVKGRCLIDGCFAVGFRLFDRRPVRGSIGCFFILCKRRAECDFRFCTCFVECFLIFLGIPCVILCLCKRCDLHRQAALFDVRHIETRVNEVGLDPVVFTGKRSVHQFPGLATVDGILRAALVFAH